MSDSHEIIKYSKQFPMKLFYQRLGHTPRHWHHSIEILFVLSGEMDVTIENETSHLKEDDLIVINPNCIHETHGSDCILIVLQMKLSMFHLDWLNADNFFFDCNSAHSEDKSAFHPLKKIIARMIHINSMPDQQNLLINYSYAFSLIHELCFFSSKPEEKKNSRSKKNMERLNSIVSYLEEHYAENLSLTSVAEQEYLTPTYLSHFFQDNMGISFSNYLTKIRLEHSLKDLLYNDYTMDQIAENNGFPNARSYAKLFSKEYKMLPSVYRKNFSGSQIPDEKLSLSTNDTLNYLELEHFDYFDKLADYLKDDTSSSLDETTLHATKTSFGIINMNGHSMHLSHTFKRFCSVGRAKEILYGDIQDMLRTQQREIGFQYIKFHGLFDDELDVFSIKNDVPVLNFYYLDQIFDFLLSIGLKPLVQLSFMPKDLAKTPDNKIFHHPLIISEPNDEKLWCYLVSSTVKHFVNRYGYAEVKTWIFTFWNETMNRFIFDFDSIDAFLHLYEITWHAVKNAYPEFAFASTSFAGSVSTFNTYQRFLDYCQSNNCMPDSYLFNFYPMIEDSMDTLKNLTREEFKEVQQKKNSALLDTNPEALTDYITQVKKLLPAQSTIYLTEWNLSPSHREWLNDTCFSSVYIVKNILSNYDKLGCFGHWCLTDWIEELPFADKTFHGGMGFFTRNKIKKPAYYAYLFLSKLKDELVAKGEGFFITKGEDSYTIMLYHYIHFSSLYAQGITFNTTFNERYHAFDFAPPKQIEFTLNHIPNGSYSITEHIVNRNYGSAFDKWLEMGAMEPETTEDIKTLEQLSAPMLKKNSISVSDEQLPISVLLEPLEIRLIEIRRKQ